jgi:thiol-disulfide isomerase/thioredoxin
MEVNSKNLEVFKKSMNESQNVIVLYHASWCPHCVVFIPTWKKFSSECSKKYNNVNLFSVEQSELENVSWKNKAGKLQKPVTNGFPTIKYYFNGNEVNAFEQERNKENLFTFVESNMVKSKPKAVKKTAVPKVKKETKKVSKIDAKKKEKK